MGIETVKLDATDQGQPLYEKFGFRPNRPSNAGHGPVCEDLQLIS